MEQSNGAGYRCCLCGQVKGVEAFHPSAVRRSSWECMECTTTRGTQLYWANRNFANALKVERGCADCGYNAHPAALQFDHLPGVVKACKVSALMMSSRKRLLAEIAKCDVVCANCHAIRTVERERITQSVAARRLNRFMGRRDDPQLGLFG